MSRSERYHGLTVFRYVTPYSRLRTLKEPDGQPACLISQPFTAAEGPEGVPHHGYLFWDLKTIGGKPIDWVDDYGLCATPAKYGVTGRRTFIVDSRGTVWGKDLGESRFVTDYPLDPKAAGWEYAD